MAITREVGAPRREVLVPVSVEEGTVLYGIVPRNLFWGICEQVKVGYCPSADNCPLRVVDKVRRPQALEEADYLASLPKDIAGLVASSVVTVMCLPECADRDCIDNVADAIEELSGART